MTRHRIHYAWTRFCVILLVVLAFVYGTTRPLTSVLRAKLRHIRAAEALEEAYLHEIAEERKRLFDSMTLTHAERVLFIRAYDRRIRARNTRLADLRSREYSLFGSLARVVPLPREDTHA